MQLFRFANPDFLYLLLLLPVVILIYILNVIRKRKALNRVGEANLVNRLIPEISRFRPAFKFALQLIAVTSGIIMLPDLSLVQKLKMLKNKVWK